MLVTPKRIAFFCCLLFAISTFAQSGNSVILLNQSGKKVNFRIKKHKLEWVNGKINLSFLSSDGKLLQINNIAESMIKDTAFRGKTIAAAIICDTITYLQLKRFPPMIEIVCSVAKKGNPIEISAQGTLYYHRKWYKYTVYYAGDLPDKKFTSSYKKSVQQ